MNDMSRPHSASRLSEDIGDVLSAIRRLIAEDEALDHARDRLHCEKPPHDPGSGLAYRFGGPSALARRMVQDGPAARDGQPGGTDFADHALIPPPRPRLIADQHVPPARGAHGGLVARRDLPPRRDAAPAAEPQELAPLRLGDSDRVDVLPKQVCGDPLPGAPQVQPAAGRSDAIRETAAVIVSTDEDDFAEAFGAKARMRPDAEPRAPADLTAEVNDQPATAAIDGVTIANTPPAADFWAAYRQSDESEDHPASPDTTSLAEMKNPAGDQALPAGLSPAGTLSSGSPDPVCMTIPAYLAETGAEEATTRPAPAADGEADVAVSDAGTAMDTPAVAALETVAPPSRDGAADNEVATDSSAADEATVREVIREIIQEELHGELGQRFSRNLRAVIRREVAAAIDEHLERI